MSALAPTASGDQSLPQQQLTICALEEVVHLSQCQQQEPQYLPYFMQAVVLTRVNHHRAYNSIVEALCGGFRGLHRCRTVCCAIHSVVKCMHLQIIRANLTLHVPCMCMCRDSFLIAAALQALSTVLAGVLYVRTQALYKRRALEVHSADLIDTFVPESSSMQFNS